MVEAVVKVTSKHQITIPKVIWKAMKLKDDDKLALAMEGGIAYLARVPKNPVKALTELSGGRKFPGAMEEFMKDRKSW